MSTFYKTPLRSDELYHWKYKDKYKKGDHWVYIYDDGSTSEATDEKLVSRTINDTMNQRSSHVKTVSTNPKQLFTTREKSTVGFKTSRPLSKPGTISTYGDDKRTVNSTTTTEKVTYGRLHMERMNLERKISDIPEKSLKTVKDLLSRFTHKKDDTPEGAKKAIRKYKEATRKNPLPKNYEKTKKEVEAYYEGSQKRHRDAMNRRQAEEQYQKDQQAADRERAFEEQSRMQSEEQYRENERNARRRQNERNKAKRRQEEERRRRRR